MARSDYLIASGDGFAHQLQTFANFIGDYATELDVSAAQVTAQASDSAYFSYVLACQQIMTNSSRQWTAWKDITRGGGNLPPTGAPVVPTLPTSVPAVAPGIEGRFRALVKQIKSNSDYNTSIGAALGIEGSEQTGPDYATLSPFLKLALNGDRVDIGWGWQGFGAFLDQCEIQVDRADGKDMVLLAIDTTPDCTDTFPFPATPTKWVYQAIYRVGDQRVGQWSKPTAIAVGG